LRQYSQSRAVKKDRKWRFPPLSRQGPAPGPDHLKLYFYRNALYRQADEDLQPLAEFIG
jgi:hypothetical protein